MTHPRSASRLRWDGAEQLAPSARDELFGPGAPFEMTEVEIGGVHREVFVQQPPDLWTYFRRTVEQRPDEIYLVDSDRSWTYTDAETSIQSIATELRDRYGIGRGDRVAIVAANDTSYALSIWAIVALGAVVVGLNGWWAAEELRAGIALTEPSLILGDRRRLERLEPFATELTVPVVEFGRLLADAHDGDRSPIEDGAMSAADDPAAILFTSGTTGTPKGATLSHRSFLHFVWCQKCMRATEAALVRRPPRPAGAPQIGSILSSPLFHVSGMVGLMMTGPGLGMKLVLAPPARWDETRHLDLTVEHHVGAWSGVPTQFLRLLRHPDFERYDLSGVVSVSGGGASFSPELVAALRERMPQARVGSGYGMTESVGLGARADAEALLSMPGVVGRADVSVQIELRHALGAVVAEGEIGEIHLSTASLFLGYWGDDDATAEVLGEDGWYRAGDFGRIVDGRLVLESRMRDLIIRGGENISPIEIEQCLCAHPEIYDAAVIGVDHEVLGQEVKAFVVCREGVVLDLAAVQSWVAERLAAFKVPSIVELRPDLPYTESGKVLKRRLVEESAST